MRVAVSNIAWATDDDDRVAEVLTGHGVQGVEIAPTTRWPDPIVAHSDEITDYRAGWEARGLEVSSLQALLYGRRDLVLFGDAETRDAALRYLERVIELASGLGAGPLVFGSPRNRRAGDRDPAEVREVAVRFFREVADVAASAGCVFCLEPNPPEYGADFATSTSWARVFVEEVDHPGFGLHLDLGGMQISGELIVEEIQACGPLLKHFHVSEPYLGPVGASDLPHDRIADALRAISYRGWVSIEMRRTEDEDPAASVAKAARLVVSAYGDP